LRTISHALNVSKISAGNIGPFDDSNDPLLRTVIDHGQLQEVVLHEEL